MGAHQQFRGCKEKKPEHTENHSCGSRDAHKQANTHIYLLKHFPDAIFLKTTEKYTGQKQYSSGFSGVIKHNLIITLKRKSKKVFCFCFVGVGEGGYINGGMWCRHRDTLRYQQ